MKLTVYRVYAAEFPSQRSARISWKAAKRLGNQDVSHKCLIGKIHVQRETLGQWTRFCRVQNVWGADITDRFGQSFQFVFRMIT